MRQLLCLVVTKEVASICDEDSGHPELATLVHQHAEGFHGRWQNALTPYDDTIYVEQKPKVGCLLCHLKK